PLCGNTCFRFGRRRRRHCDRRRNLAMTKTEVASAVSVVRIDRLELAFEPGPWPFADKRRPEIDAHFAKLQRERPALWNGRVLLLRRYGIDRHVFGGAFLETDFASFVAWRDWGFPDAGV